MKNKMLFALLLVVSFMACKDKPVTITPEEDPFKVMPAHFKQKILLEDFVSEALDETIENSYLVKELEKKYNDQLIVVNLHKQDWLETPFTNDLVAKLGGMSTYPRGAINRMPGVNTIEHEDTYTLLSPINWEYSIGRAMAEDPKIALAAETFIKPENLASIKLHIAHKDALTKDMRIGLYMVEDNINAIAQQGVNGTFVHKNVMKQSLLDIQGDTVNLSSDNPDGEITVKEYNNIDLKFYHVENLYLVAFVFNYDNDFRKMKIYNAIKVKFGGVKFWNQ